jgi:hypothetical protein
MTSRFELFDAVIFGRGQEGKATRLAFRPLRQEGRRRCMGAEKTRAAEEWIASWPQNY